MAIVHEWVSSRAGSEKTFEAMTVAFPDADRYALTMNDGVLPDLDGSVRTTAIDRVGVLRERRAVSLPLMPIAWRAMRVPRYDVVVTSSHAFSRYFPTHDAMHLSYVYTPIRYGWLPGVDGRGASRVAAPARACLRFLDKRTVRRTDGFAGISNAVVRRINEFYGREAEVIYPPVDTEFFAPTAHPTRDFVLGVSRWIPYKRLDLVIRVAERLGIDCVIAGSGPDESRLRAMADEVKVRVSFVESPSDGRLRELYQNAALVVFPPIEDFGIVPVEAQACATPVVAVAAGGSLDTVVEGVTGALAPTQTVDDLAVAATEAMRLSTERGKFEGHVSQFSRDAFVSNFRDWITRAERTRGRT